MDERHAGSDKQPDDSAARQRDRRDATGPAGSGDREADLVDPADLDEREARLQEQESRARDREQKTAELLAAADERDAKADQRDRVADDRERIASLHSFVHDQEYEAALRARRASALDRSESQNDRTSGASDRAQLSERHPGADPDGEDSAAE